MSASQEVMTRGNNKACVGNWSDWQNQNGFFPPFYSLYAGKKQWNIGNDMYKCWVAANVSTELIQVTQLMVPLCPNRKNQCAMHFAETVSICSIYSQNVC